jgi:hypothetical protein
MIWKMIGSGVFVVLAVVAGRWYVHETAQQTVLAELQNHQAQTRWLPDANPSGRTLEDVTRQKITADYTNAWKQQSICLLTGDSTGLYSYFVPPLRAIIRQNASLVAAKELVQKDTKHSLQLRFYALDGQLVTLTDSAMVDQQISGFTQTEKRYYHALLLLEEGHWRIKNLRLD